MCFFKPMSMHIINMIIIHEIICTNVKCIYISYTSVIRKKKYIYTSIYKFVNLKFVNYFVKQYIICEKIILYPYYKNMYLKIHLILLVTKFKLEIFFFTDNRYYIRLK